MPLRKESRHFITFERMKPDRTVVEEAGCLKRKALTSVDVRSNISQENITLLSCRETVLC